MLSSNVACLLLVCAQDESCLVSVSVFVSPSPSPAFPLELELELHKVVSRLMWMLGTNSGSIKEQYMVLATGPSLQPQPFVVVVATVSVIT